VFYFGINHPTRLAGFLNKRGEVNKAFQRRYFVLKGNLLFYFESRTDKEPLGLIIVEGCTIELSNEVDNYCFEIAFNGNRTYILSADNQESMEAWMKALTCAGYEYKRIILAELQRQLQELDDAKNKVLGSAIDGLQMFTSETRPRPPPRRTNPFNRPAPPPPDSSLKGGVVMSPMPFINGYFGSSNARLQQEQLMMKQDAPNRSPHGTPKVNRRHPPHTQTATSVFYPDARGPEVVGGVSTVLPRKNTGRTSSSAKEDFVRTHERFRRELMPDVKAYRERHNQPLIDL
ncbi:hypothetical protein KR054_007777, partial [Drosophila jambulina]